MAGSRNSSVRRRAAIAAADRVRLLLAVVEDDAFLSEVLHSADKAIVDIHMTPANGQRDAAPETVGGRRLDDSSRASLLGPAYHTAKKHALRRRGRRPPGRA
ncbi:hypothetical protein [Antarcticimicrobium sediminis]|uniref:Uncharacterized protein n=1 Tax=Antarcticimicrobium sediminis TaxID=2546227 RepID=A0A4R5EVL4_9RHOB|nr:hypothetical protein [Antarcticimicrobium sediminis]TDE38872.1 hypothetical protein E1B25_07565 [Antarcticimicrobium sediminis]